MRLLRQLKLSQGCNMHHTCNILNRDGTTKSTSLNNNNQTRQETDKAQCAKAKMPTLHALLLFIFSVLVPDIVNPSSCSLKSPERLLATPHKTPTSLPLPWPRPCD